MQNWLKILLGKNENSAPYIHYQKQATSALIKFCEDHGDNAPNVSDLRSCLKSLESGDIKSAIEYYQKVPLGGIGCFNDWIPPVVYSHETPEYVQAVFEALVTQWSLSIQLSISDTKT